MNPFEVCLAKMRRKGGSAKACQEDANQSTNVLKKVKFQSQLLLLLMKMIVMAKCGSIARGCEGGTL